MSCILRESHTIYLPRYATSLFNNDKGEKNKLLLSTSKDQGMNVKFSIYLNNKD